MKREERKVPKLRFTGFEGEWKKRKLIDFVDFYSGLTYSPDDVRESGVLVLRSSNVKHGEIVDADNVYVNPSKATSENVRVGDVIVVVRNGSRALIGKHAIIKNDKPNTVIGAFMTGIRSNYSSFVNALLDTRQFEKEIEKNMGATINQITGYMFAQMMFMIPSADEQEKIGQFLTNLDNLIIFQQRKLDQMKEYKSGMLQKMFPKKGEKVPEIRFPGFTDDWEQRKFGELFSEKRDKTKTENEDTLLSCAIDGMFLNSEFFGHFRGSTTIGYLKVKKNDLILSAQNLHLGNANVNLRFESGIISPAYKVYDIVDCNPYFVQAWVKKDSTKEFFLSCTTEGASVCRKNIDWNELNQKNIPVPCVDEQNKMGNLFNALDNLITLHQRKLDQMKEYKKGLLQQMFV